MSSRLTPVAVPVRSHQRSHDFVDIKIQLALAQFEDIQRKELEGEI